MEKIPMEQTVSSALKQSAEWGAGNGYDEQWQRALEKAYMEEQVAIMRSTGRPDVGTGLMMKSQSCKPQRTPMQHDETIIVNMEQDRVCQIPENQISQIDSAGFGLHVEPVSAFLRPTLGMSDQCCMRPHFPVSGNTKAISPSCKVTISLQLVLPPSSSIKALVSDQGVHVIVRDATVENGDVFRMLKKIREVCSNIGCHLHSVTLNGERIWLNQDLFSGLDKDLNTNQGIDHLY